MTEFVALSVLPMKMHLEQLKMIQYKVSYGFFSGTKNIFRFVCAVVLGKTKVVGLRNKFCVYQKLQHCETLRTL